MKIVMGVEERERLKVSGDLVKGLRFEDPAIELVHVLERVGEEGLPQLEGARPDLIARYLKMQEDEAQALLAQGEAELKQRGLACRTKLLVGLSANRIIAHAQESGGDLLALGSTGKGPIESVIVGSVGRKALISAQCSVLIAKKSVVADRPLTVVFATDHSAYANRCMEKLLSWRPKGIGRSVITTVYPEQLLKAMSTVMENFKADVSTWVRAELERNNAQLIQKLAPLGGEFKSRVESGRVGDTLERVMKEEQADLLVLGAQGHGFIERLTIGGVSLDQALRRPYSVLVLRA
jgi:nucleotide-binding universal stress UspA family protein